MEQKKDIIVSRGVVLRLYDALNRREVAAVHQTLAPDLEWWFHGPPNCQYLMRLLTGTTGKDDSFSFRPLKVATFGPIVVAEGCDTARSASWVHAWTLRDGVITQVREYFNTSLTVTLLGGGTSGNNPAELVSDSSIPVWQSSVSDKVGAGSVPGLVLAI